jgi:hypothetical protein
MPAPTALRCLTEDEAGSLREREAALAMLDEVAAQAARIETVRLLFLLLGDQALDPVPADAPDDESAGALLQRRYGSEVESSTWWHA